ncbi:MAG: imidazoleglycerol-phosphate dehydratase HisB [Thaumarchaeota archaeon]|nr:imidazoleglycerol-phosphate dehydratase HisB [Nitrososphaerota archaeon]
MRIGEAVNKTEEVEVSAKINLDGRGKTKISTSVAFLDHMLASLATHSMLDIEVQAKGDLQHHIVEDSAICLGKALDKALGERKGLTRFGSSSVPMDEALAQVTVDLVKRPYCVLNMMLERESIEGMAKEDIFHFIRAFATSSQITLHMHVQYGENDHHKVEAAFKALALALRQAASRDPRRSGAPSSKGAM